MNSAILVAGDPPPKSRVWSRNSRRAAPTIASRVQSVEKNLRGFQVGRLEPFGEPVVDRLEKLQGLGGTALIA